MLGDEKDEISLDDDIVQKLVLVHLLHNCYQNTAEAFINSCSLMSEERKKVTLEGKGNPDVMMLVTPPQALDPNGDVDMTPTNIAEKEPNNSFLSQAHPNGESDVLMDNNATDILVEERRKTLTSFLSHAYEKTLQLRKKLRQLVLKGDIQAAIELCQNRFPAIISTDSDSSETTPVSIDLSFKLHCQHFIECIRNGDAAEALLYAQQVLSQFGFIDSKYLQELQDVVALIAYTDPSTSPVSFYLSQGQRELIADAINSSILNYYYLPEESPLERISKQLTVVKELISQSEKKPRKNEKISPWQLKDIFSLELQQS